MNRSSSPGLRAFSSRDMTVAMSSRITTTLSAGKSSLASRDRSSIETLTTEGLPGRPIVMSNWRKSVAPDGFTIRFGVTRSTVAFTSPSGAMKTGTRPPTSSAPNRAASASYAPKKLFGSTTARGDTVCVTDPR